MKKQEFRTEKGRKNATLRRQYEARTEEPGEFDGEARYVPYFWAFAEEGSQDEEEADGVLVFDVTTSDIDLFPELARTDSVRIMKRADGQVAEVRRSQQSGLLEEVNRGRA